MPELIATRRLSYGTRRLQAAEPFTASKQDARVLVALGRATYRTAEVAPQVTKETEVEQPAQEVKAPDVAEQAAVNLPQPDPDVRQPAKPGRKKAQSK